MNESNISTTTTNAAAAPVCACAQKTPANAPASAPTASVQAMPQPAAPKTTRRQGRKQH